MWDHVGFGVSDPDCSRPFYAAALSPLGITIAAQGEDWTIMRGPKGGLWFGRAATIASPIHLAFAGESRTAVQAFYSAAVAAGGRDNGAPGLRAQYHPDYFGAFVIDPDGHNVEAVCHLLEPEA
jgi:catechol 2,3-dioxygenase-like lactoylglutathione lyase family enzyme